MNRPRAAFTLLELMLAVAIASLLLIVAIPSLSGIFAEDQLRLSFDEFDAFAQTAQKRAIEEKRSFTLVWEKDGVVLVPEVPTAEDAAAGPKVFNFPEDSTIVIERPIALVKDAPMEWTFWRSGACEPVRVLYDGKDGRWEAQYEPLTGRGTLVLTDPK